MTAHQFQTIAPFLVIFVVLALRLRAMARLRPLNLHTLWIMPVVITMVAGAVLFLNPLTMNSALYALAGAAIGATLGWQRGRLTAITRDSRGQLMQKGSPAAMLLLLGVIGARIALRSYLGIAPGQPVSGPALAATDGLLAMAVGLIVVSRVELYLRAKRILAGRA